MVKQLNLKEGDKLDWEWKVVDGEMGLVIIKWSRENGSSVTKKSK